MKDSYILSIDCGTQSMRGFIFDKKGNILVKVKKEFTPYYSTRPGWAEQDPNLYWNTLCTICKQISEDHKELFNSVIGICVTTLRDTCILVDKNGEVLRPAILWLDQRKLSKPKPMKIPYVVATNVVGMINTANKVNKACHAHWIQEHQPEIWKKTHKFLLLSGYLNYKLTGEFKDSIASQIGHIPFNYKKFKWESKMGMKRQFFQIEEEKLVDIVEPGQILGHITDKASSESGLKVGLPVISTGSDKGCETLGVGCVDNTSGSISLGSQAAIQTTSKKYYEVMNFIPPFPAVMPQTYNPEILIYRGYWMITWFKKEFAQKELKEATKKGILPEELLNERLKKVPPGCNGLVLQPYWGAGIKNPEARGAILGFSDIHTRIHIYRAIIEGIGFALKEGIERIEKKSGCKMERIMLSGGGSQSDMICQISADIFDKPVYRVQTYETSGLGASILGYVAMGEFESYEEAIKSMVHYSDTFYPNPKDRDIYDNLYNNVYKSIYPRLRPIYRRMHNLGI